MLSFLSVQDSVEKQRARSLPPADTCISFPYFDRKRAFFGNKLQDRQGRGGIVGSFTVFEKLGVADPVDDGDSPQYDHKPARHPPVFPGNLANS